jgi:1-acyl-sn-glycerol-3-phosphate acyltransferase
VSARAKVVPLPRAGAAPPGAAAPWEATLADVTGFLRRRLGGDYVVDDLGFDAELADRLLLPLCRVLYREWFRAEVEGIAHVPATGGALLVANHAGTMWALDSVMTATAVHEEHPAHRHLRMLAADLVFRTPVVGVLARRLGATYAGPEDALALLRAGELVGVWPEGFKGLGKRFRDRYRLQRFGRGGFVQTAIRARVPIVPVSIVGSEEIHPMLGESRTAARLLGLPYFPLTPTFPWLGPLGLVPLPTKWYLEFGAPLATDAYPPEAADDPAVVFDLAERVRDTIQQTLDRLLTQRTSIWR